MWYRSVCTEFVHVPSAESADQGLFWWELESFSQDLHYFADLIVCRHSKLLGLNERSVGAILEDHHHCIVWVWDEKGREEDQRGYTEM